jgi:hypothetical protein
MAYYPLSQITTNLYTNGFELYNKITQESYIGYYYTLSNGQYYSGKTPQDLPSFELIVNPPSLYPSLGTFNSPPGYSISTNEGFTNFLYPNDFNYRDYPKYAPITKYLPYYNPMLPTQQDYQNGVFQRFFCKKTNEVQYIEINKNTFDQLVAKNPNIQYSLYLPFYLDWQLTGTEEQVATVNKKNTELTSFRLKLPRLSDYLKSNWAKYYQ